MKNDVNITQIVNIYNRSSTSWKRPNLAARRYDAVVYFEEGQIEYYFPGTTVLAKKGDILVLPGNLPYTGQCQAAPPSFYVIDFLCEDPRQLEEFGAPCSFPAKDPDGTLASFQKALALWNTQSATATVETKATVYSALAQMLRSINGNSETASAILGYIMENISDPKLSVNRICQHFYISDSQLRRHTYKQVALSPNEYIQLLRIRKAKSLLSTTDKDIKYISGACGFSSQYYFSRVFSKTVGMSPSEYRKCTHI